MFHIELYKDKKFYKMAKFFTLDEAKSYLDGMIESGKYRDCVSGRVLNSINRVVYSQPISGWRRERVLSQMKAQEEKVVEDVKSSQENIRHVVTPDGRHYYGQQAYSYQRGQHNRNYARYGIRR